MTAPQVLNTIGLVLGMLGVLLIFIWGPPQPTLEEGIGLGLEDDTRLQSGLTVAQHNELVRGRRRRHMVFSRVGLTLVFVGFGLQLVAVWI